MGFGNLRVINEDRIAPGSGFGTHGHRDMEIISYVLERRARAQGQHGHRRAGRRDSRDPPGRRAAHERRHAACSTASSTTRRTETTHFLQIWIQPNVRGIAPELRAEALRRRRQARPAAPGRLARRPRRLGDDACRRDDLRRPVRRRRSGRAARSTRRARPTCTWCAASVDGQRRSASRPAMPLALERRDRALTDRPTASRPKCWCSTSSRSTELSLHHVFNSPGDFP